jgi:hypothetical protein
MRPLLIFVLTVLGVETGHWVSWSSLQSPYCELFNKRFDGSFLRSGLDVVANKNWF